MTDSARTMAAAAAGAAIGGLAGFLFLTDRGRWVRGQIGPALEGLSRDLDQFRTTVAKAAGAATEGWALLSASVGEGRVYDLSAFRRASQSSPFERDRA